MTTAKQTIDDAVQSNGEVIIPEYQPTQQALAELRNRYNGVIFNVATEEGMQAAIEARKTVRKYRTSLESKRKKLKAPALAYGRALDGQAKEITEALRSLEDPIDEQIKAEENRQAQLRAEAERQERARIDAHRKTIETMRAAPLQAIGQPAETVRVQLDDIQATPLDTLEEFASEAALVRDEAVGKLHELYTHAKDSEERAAKEQAEREQREAREREEAAQRQKEQNELEELRRFKAEQDAKAAQEEKRQAVQREKAARESAEREEATDTDKQFGASTTQMKQPLEQEKNVAAARRLDNMPLSETSNEPACSGYDQGADGDSTATAIVTPQTVGEATTPHLPQANDVEPRAMAHADLCFLAGLDEVKADEVLDAIEQGIIRHIYARYPHNGLID